MATRKAPAAGMKIINRAKAIRRAHPGKSWISCMKEAGREFRAGKVSGHKKKKSHRIAGKKRKVHRKKIGSSSPHRDRVDKKRVDISIGSVRSATYDKLADALIAREKSTTAKQYHAAMKRIAKHRKEIRALC